MTKPYQQRLLFGTKPEIIGAILEVLKKQTIPIEAKTIKESIEKMHLSVRSSKVIANMIANDLEDEVHIISKRSGNKYIIKANIKGKIGWMGAREIGNMTISEAVARAIHESP